MKKYCLSLIILILLPACSEKPVDVETEKAAIKEVIAKETQSWINQDFVSILETLVQDESAIRVTIGRTGYNSLEGYDKVYNFYKKSMDSDWSDFEEMSFNHSNFRIHVCQETAVAMFDQRMTYYYGGELQETSSKEMRMLKKVKGDWKIMLLQWVDMSSFEADPGVEE